MINVYAVNYTDSNNVFHDEWTEIQAIPVDSEDDIALVNPTITLKIDAAETMNFSVYANTGYYNAFQQLTSYIRVDYDGTTIFLGRVLTIDTGYHGERKIQCEGPIAFLNDTYLEGKKESERNKTTLASYLQTVINNHNDNVGDDEHKKIYLGEVPGQYSNAISDEQKVTADDRKFGETSWVTTKSALENLKSYHGGYFRIRCVMQNYTDTIGQYGEGNIDLNDRTVVHNNDGTISTERSITVGFDNHQVLIPTVVNGEILSDEDAIDYYVEHDEYLGIFDTVAEAESYAIKLHHRQNWYYGGQYQVPVCYLDWLKHYNRSNTTNQTIAIGKNIIDLNYITEVNNIFTAIIPFGKSGNNTINIRGYREDIHGANNYLRVDALPSLYTDAQLTYGYHTADDYRESYNRYGLIFKTVEFQEASSKAELFTKVAEWIKENYFGGIDAFTVSALDMHQIGANEDPILTGNRYNITYIDDSSVTRALTCLSIKFDLYNPEKNQYSFGIPSTSLSRNYSINSNKSSSTPSPGGYKPPAEETDPQDVWLTSVLDMLSNHLVWKKSNGDVEGGPNSTRMMNYFIRPSPNVDENGNSKYYVWKPTIASVTGGIVNFAKDENGKPIGTWLEKKKSEITADYLLSIGLVQYIKQEYGIDIRNGETIGSTVNMPTVIQNDDGSTSIYGPILSTDSGEALVQKLLDLAKSGNIMNIFEKDGMTISAYIDELGDYHYYQKNADGTIKVDDQGNPIEVTVKQIDAQIVQINSEIFELNSDYISFKSATESNIAQIIIEQDQILTEVSAADSQIYSAIIQTASEIRSEVQAAESSIFNSVISQTASEIRAEVSAAGSSIYNSVISQTASQIRSEVIAATSGVYSAINQTASEIRIEFGKKSTVYYQYSQPSGTTDNPIKDGDIWIQDNKIRTYNDMAAFSYSQLGSYDYKEFYGSIIKVYDGTTNSWKIATDDQLTNMSIADTKFTQTEVNLLRGDLKGLYSEFHIEKGEIRSTVENVKGELGSQITQTANQIKSEVYAANSQIYSSITQTASQIRSEVVNSISGLQSSITQQADQISLVVEGTGSNAHIKPAEIVAAINAQTGQSIVKLSADIINMNGDVIADRLDGNVLTLEECYADFASFEDLDVQSGITFWSGATLKYGSGGYVTAGNIISGASVSGNVLTITNMAGSSWTFSKATTLDPSWSGSVLTMAAKQTNGGTTSTVASKTLGFGGLVTSHDIELQLANNGTPTKVANVSNIISCPVKVEQLTTGNPTSRYTRDIQFSVASLLTTGSYNTAGTKTPGDSYIGFSSVTFTIPNASGFTKNATSYNTSNSNQVGAISKSGLTANTYMYWTVGGKKYHIVVNA